MASLTLLTLLTSLARLPCQFELTPIQLAAGMHTCSAIKFCYYSGSCAGLTLLSAALTAVTVAACIFLGHDLHWHLWYRYPTHLDFEHFWVCVGLSTASTTITF
jgi:hypothetical protein